MLQRIDLRGRHDDPRGLLPRAALDVESATHAVRPLIEAVRERGAEAIQELSARFDGIAPPDLRVPADIVHKAAEQLDPRVRAALTESIARVRTVHEAQRPGDSTVEVVPGGTVTQRFVPVRRVGLYAPGGLTVYPSTVVMDVVPAQVAGVRSLALASPPQLEHGGRPHPTVLAACALLGVDEVYAVGGAQAMAMFAYGADACAPVDLVTGPGNVYVAAAKRLLRGVVGIDAEAGPTEIAVLADETADPVHVAADLLSQAEHDELAASVLVTTSTELADAVRAELAVQVAMTRHAERVTAALSGRQSGIVLVRDLDQAVEVLDSYAAEHVEVITRDAARVAGRITNAGCVFVGTYSPVSLGDYCAGSNHVLPTGRTARHTSGLSVHTFLKRMAVVEYSEQALAGVADHVVALALAEDLPAHAAAVEARAGRP